MTRGEFVRRAAAAGGSAYTAMAALGLVADARPAPFSLRGRGDGIHVAIIGAGVAGLCAAYELGKLGYRCTILETRARPGGRVWTVRDGTTFTETGGISQTATFGRGNYLNAGAARVPQNHVTIDYYRELGIAIEPFLFTNNNAYYYDGSTRRRLREREAKMDLRGEVDELLAKAISRDAVDAPLTADDKARLLTFLIDDGGLDADLLYRGTDRRGYTTQPAVDPGTVGKPIDMNALIRAGFGKPQIEEADIDWQPVLYQPVGGMDALPVRFAALLAASITFGAQGRELRRMDGGRARIVYGDARGGARTLDADLCICTLPLSVLRSLPADFSEPFARAIAAVAYAPSTKVAFAARRRFWEDDDRILGGISWTNTPMTQIMYPSGGYLGPTGVLVGAYNFDAAADAYGKLAPAQRIAAARSEGSAIHPQYATDITSAFTVAWQNVAENLGGWANWTDAQRRDEYKTLRAFDGPYILAGEHMSYIPAWQAGALESARAVVAQLHTRTGRAR
jgi:monoamine oxidase